MESVTDIKAIPLIKAENIGVYEARRWLIRNVDISVHAGEIMTLIGPNGGGKSTVVKSLLGVIHPHEGQITRRPNLTIGYVPQKLHIDWTLPLTLDRLMTLTNPVEAPERRAALERVGIAHLNREPVTTLSGGEFQRALLARAIARQPDILVLDEPVQGVDVAGQAELYQLIDEIRQEIGCGVLLISHDLHIVMAASDRVLCLNGHVCCQGSPESVTNDPAYLQLFGPRAALVAVYKHQHDHIHLPDGRIQDHCGHDHESHDPEGHNHEKRGHEKRGHEKRGHEKRGAHDTAG